MGLLLRPEVAGDCQPHTVQRSPSGPHSPGGRDDRHAL